MKGIVAAIQSFATAIGGPGLLLIALLDSSILSLPEVNDLLIVYMVTRHKERLVYYAAMTTIGSIAGCFILYGIGRKGGEAFLRRRFHERHIERAMELFQRYGVLAVAVPAIMPPPAPFKIFVLLAGVSQVPPGRFAVAVAMGRGVRYFGEGLLALWYGDQAMDYIRRNGQVVSLAIAATVLAVALLYIFWRSRRQRLTAR